MLKAGITGFVALLLSLSTLQASAAPTTVKIFPIEDQSANDANRDGVWDSPNPPDQDVLLVYRGPATGYNFRVAMEFDLGAIPANATINSATLFLKYDGASGDRDAVAMQLNGFAGDGVLTLADFNRPVNQIVPLLDSYDPSGGAYFVNVTPFIQSLIDGDATAAGFFLENLLIVQTPLRSGEDPNPAFRPSLSITFAPAPPPPDAVPLPAALVPALLLSLTVIARRARHHA